MDLDRPVLDATRCDIPDAVWECPDVFDTGDRHRPDPVADGGRDQAASEQAVPMVWYATGEWIDGRLEPDTDAPPSTTATVCTPRSRTGRADGRRIQPGWIRTDLDPRPGRRQPRRHVCTARAGSARGRTALRATPARELHVLRDTALVVGTTLGDTSTTDRAARNRATPSRFPSTTRTPRSRPFGWSTTDRAPCSSPT